MKGGQPPRPYFPHIKARSQMQQGGGNGRSNGPFTGHIPLISPSLPPSDGRCAHDEKTDKGAPDDQESVACMAALPVLLRPNGFSCHVDRISELPPWTSLHRSPSGGHSCGCFGFPLRKITSQARLLGRVRPQFPVLAGLHCGCFPEAGLLP